jgi:ribosomal peptide maturation radical SAM protein 1
LRVALVVMPFAAVDRPNLATGLLQAALKARGIACETKYLAIELTRFLGYEPYRRLVQRVANGALAGEWVFSQAFHGEAFSRWETYEAEVLRGPECTVDEESRGLIRELLPTARAFLAHAEGFADWGAYDLVGFTSSFEQTFPSLCLARTIRRRWPHVLLAAGGANFEGSMGRVYMERFEFLDFICTGEGDAAFPALCESLRDGAGHVPPGILHRRGERVLPERDERPRGFVDLDALPVPDYDDFFDAFDAACPTRPILTLTMEASRGCWWGQVSHCTFCGLNGDAMTFRRKSARRVEEEMDSLTGRHGADFVQFADNILDTRAFEDLIPGWAERGEKTKKFFEIKSNLTRRHLVLLSRAGVTDVQAGIESLADGMLRVMGKGVTAAQNVALMRWCAELGIAAQWNLIYGFPREDLADYRVLLEAAEKLTHLPPPGACTRIRLDRFSPNHFRYREEGFTSIRPLAVYRHLFPFDGEDLERLAYYFDYEHPHSDRLAELSAPLRALTDLWKERADAGEAGTFALLPHFAGGWVIADRRFNRPGRGLRPTELDLAFLLACDAPTGAAAAREKVARAFPEATEESVDAAFARLLECEAVARFGTLHVTIPLLPQGLAVRGLRRAHDDEGRERWPTATGPTRSRSTRRTTSEPSTRSAARGA